MATLTLLNLPIGNIEDITARVKNTLEKEQHFVVEDTRSFKALLHALGISMDSKKVHSYHDQSSDTKVNQLVNMMDNGLSLHFASEAGSPVISDPAFPLVKEAIKRGHQVKTFSGICSPIYALELSGLPAIPFQFHGFLGREGGKVKEKALELSGKYGTHIVFESPHRIEKTLDIFCEEMPDCEFVLCRELSKKFESVYRFSSNDWNSFKEEIEYRGEMVFLFNVSKQKKEEVGVQSDKTKQLAQDIIDSGMKPKLVSKLVAEVLQLKSGDVYNRLNK